MKKSEDMKKRRLKKSVKRFFKFLFILLIVLGLYFFYTKIIRNDKPNENLSSNQPDPIPVVEENYLNEVVNKDKLSESQLSIITSFLDTYYKSIKELKEYDMTQYFASGSDYASINQAAMQLLIGARKMKPNDLTMKSVKYDIEIEEVKKVDNEVIVTLLEDSYARFSFMSDIESKSYDVLNTFTLVEEDGLWKISKYEKEKDFYVMITDKYQFDGQAQLNRIRDDILFTIQSSVVSDRAAYRKYLTGSITPKTCDHGYDREKALAYALKYVQERNSNEWEVYGSNCQNYASQVVYNGGVVMDYFGSENNNLQWKYYDSIHNSKEIASGFSYTWTYVPYFYEYAKNNTGRGLCAEVDVNLYYAEPGDIIHVGTSGPTRHAVVVIGAYEKDGKVIDILINSNTNDLENYPMSSYIYPYTSLIKIYGSND